MVEEESEREEPLRRRTILSMPQQSDWPSNSPDYTPPLNNQQSSQQEQQPRPQQSRRFRLPTVIYAQNSRTGSIFEMPQSRLGPSPNLIIRGARSGKVWEKSQRYWWRRPGPALVLQILLIASMAGAVLAILWATNSIAFSQPTTQNTNNPSDSNNLPTILSFVSQVYRSKDGRKLMYKASTPEEISVVSIGGTDFSNVLKTVKCPGDLKQDDYMSAYANNGLWWIDSLYGNLHFCSLFAGSSNPYMFALEISIDKIISMTVYDEDLYQSPGDKQRTTLFVSTPGMTYQMSVHLQDYLVTQARTFAHANGTQATISIVPHVANAVDPVLTVMTVFSNSTVTIQNFQFVPCSVNPSPQLPPIFTSPFSTTALVPTMTSSSSSFSSSASSISRASPKPTTYASWTFSADYVVPCRRILASSPPFLYLAPLSPKSSPSILKLNLLDGNKTEINDPNSLSLVGFSNPPPSLALDPTGKSLVMYCGTGASNMFKFAQVSNEVNATNSSNQDFVYFAKAVMYSPPLGGVAVFMNDSLIAVDAGNNVRVLKAPYP